MSRPNPAPLLLGLLLLAVCMPALAQNGRNVADACPSEARESTDIPDQDPERARTTALRAKYTAWPFAATPVESNKTPHASSGGGGGNSDGEADTPRGLNSRWHSFLPGMFR